MTNKDFIESIRLSGFIARAFSISFFILLFAILVSYLLNDWMWFARISSLLVSIGVITTAYDMKGRMSKSNAPDEYIRQSMILEVIIIVIGTLVWGFGDLINKI
jgi:hypothetical protein